jgi:hypothetical protein
MTEELTLFVKGFPLGITAEEVAGLFWDKTGLHIFPQRINVKDHDAVASAYIHVTGKAMAAFLNLQIHDQMAGGTLTVHPFKLPEERGERRPSRFKVTTEQLTVELNRNGIRKL